MEKEDIFEGVKFGSKFLTRDGRITVYDGKVDGDIPHFSIEGYSDYGIPYLPIQDKENKIIYLTPWLDEELKGCGDIVSRYHEEIDDEKIGEIAEKCYEPIMSIFDWIDAFKAGYKKAKEE